MRTDSEQRITSFSENKKSTGDGTLGSLFFLPAIMMMMMMMTMVMIAIIISMFLSPHFHSGSFFVILFHFFFSFLFFFFLRNKTFTLLSSLSEQTSINLLHNQCVSRAIVFFFLSLLRSSRTL